MILLGTKGLTVELSRSEIGHVADVLAILRGSFRTLRKAAGAHGIPETAFTRLKLRPATFKALESTLDAIAAAAKVTREDLLAGRALAAARLAALAVAGEGTPS